MDKGVLEMIAQYKIPSMIPPQVYDYLAELGRQWKNQGTVVELGSWFGASTVALLTGLTEVGFDRKVYCYDRWKATRGEVEKAAEEGIDIELGQDLKDDFLWNMSFVYNRVETIQGDIRRNINFYPNERIEYCILDAPKKNPLFSDCIRRLGPYWIPGVTIVGLLDYNHYRKFEGDRKDKLLAPVRFIENNADCFTRLKDFWPVASGAFFLYKGGELYVD